MTVEGCAAVVDDGTVGELAAEASLEAAAGVGSVVMVEEDDDDALCCISGGGGNGTVSWRSCRTLRAAA